MFFTEDDEVVQDLCASPPYPSLSERIQVGQSRRNWPEVGIVIADNMRRPVFSRFLSEDNAHVSCGLCHPYAPGLHRTLTNPRLPCCRSKKFQIHTAAPDADGRPGPIPARHLESRGFDRIHPQLNGSQSTANTYLWSAKRTRLPKPRRSATVEIVTHPRRPKK